MTDRGRHNERLEERQSRWGFASLSPECDGELDKQIAMIVNVSSNGLCVETTSPVDIGRQVIVHVKAEHGSRDLLAEVRWARQSGEDKWDLGLEIDHLPLLAGLEADQPCTVASRDAKPLGSEERRTERRPPE